MVWRVERGEDDRPSAGHAARDGRVGRVGDHLVGGERRGPLVPQAVGDAERHPPYDDAGLGFLVGGQLVVDQETFEDVDAGAVADAGDEDLGELAGGLPQVQCGADAEKELVGGPGDGLFVVPGQCADADRDLPGGVGHRLPAELDGDGVPIAEPYGQQRDRGGPGRGGRHGRGCAAPRRGRRSGSPAAPGDLCTFAVLAPLPARDRGVQRPRAPLYARRAPRVPAARCGAPRARRRVRVRRPDARPRLADPRPGEALGADPVHRTDDAAARCSTRRTTTTIRSVRSPSSGSITSRPTARARRRS